MATGARLGNCAVVGRESFRFAVAGVAVRIDYWAGR